MFDFLANNFKKGIQKIKSNPQLAYTVFLAFVIVISFLYISSNFIDIAQNAQERLINVRMGSVLDVFEKFTGDSLEDPKELSKKIKQISEENETLRTFEVISFEEEKRIVLAALNEDSIGDEKEENFLFNLAITNPSQSFTTEIKVEGERFYETVRAITNSNGEVLGVLKTSQSLSRADQLIEESIQRGIMVLLAVLIAIMFLFFRHAKIIDYIALYRKTKQINEMKDEFISMVSHELRTPLTAVKGYASMMQDTKTNEEQDEYLDMIRVQVQRLGDLIEDILDTSRIEQGRLELNKEAFNPKEVIEETVDSLRYNAEEENNLELIYKTKDIGLIEADKDRLRQIITNLVGNSIKYTKEGKVEVITRVADSYLEIIIEDTGIGMTPEQQDKLFEKFYRAKSKETEDITGTGLGMWITKQLVEKMDGKIIVQSIKDEGTKIIVKFPYKGKPKE